MPTLHQIWQQIINKTTGIDLSPFQRSAELPILLSN